MLCAAGIAAAGAPAAAYPAPAAAQVATEPTAEEGGADLTAPDVASARTIARLQGRPVEVLGERTEFGSVFVLPDGTMAAGQATGPVWVRQGGDGSQESDWAPVDLTLVAGDDGLVRPVAQPADVTFSGAADGAAPFDLVSMTDPTSGVVARVRWEGSLPQPRLEGRRAVYEDVEPGIDLVLEATATGFEQFFVVNEEPAGGELPSLPMSVVADGAELQTAPDGGLQVVSEGQVVASARAPHMWDAQADLARAFPVTKARPAEQADAPRLAPMPAWVREGDHRRDGADAVEPAGPVPNVVGGDVPPSQAESVEVRREVEQVAPNEVAIALTPQPDFLQADDTTYPVVIDPDVNFIRGFDTYVLSGFSNARSGETELDVGTYNGGANVARAFVHFPISPIVGKQVLDADLYLYNFHSWSCTPRTWEVWSTWGAQANASTVWGNQPTFGAHWATNSETYGYSGGCPGGWTVTPITNLAQAWAAGTDATGYMAIKAQNETDNLGWKKFFSSDNGAWYPSVWVTYNTAPNTPTGAQISSSPSGAASGSWTSSKTPRLSATLTDPDGDNIDGNFYLYDSAVWDSGNRSNYFWSKPSGFVQNGAVASVTTPMLTEGATYVFRVRGSDWNLEGPPLDFRFGVDTIAPAAPTLDVVDAGQSSEKWVGEPNQARAFTVKMPVDASVTAYRWGLDKAPDVTQQVAASSGATATLNVTPTDAGRHVLQVQSVDRAGNVSGIARYVFRVGQAGIVVPDDGIRVVRQVRIAIEGNPELTHVSFEWRRGPDSEDTGKPIPAANLYASTGAAWSSDRQSLPTGTGYTTWDVAETLGYLGGPAQVRAKLYKSATATESTPTQWVTVIVDPDADGAATTTIGPSSVNLLTGDNTLSVTDVEEFGLSVVRTASSRDTDAGYEPQPNRLTVAQQDATSLVGLVGNTTVSVDTSHKHSGTTSYKVTGASGTTDSFVAIGGDGGLRLGFVPGARYRISAWVFVPKATTLTPQSDRGLRLALFTRANGAYSNPVTTGQITPLPTYTDGWQQVSVDVTIPADATEAFLRMYNGFNDPAKVVYYDDIHVERLWAPFGPQWSAGTVDAASGSQYTRITKPYDDVAQLELTGGGEIWFTLGDKGAWWPEPGAEALTLTSTGPDSWRLTDLDGTVTDFAREAATGNFPVRTSMPVGAAGATRHVYESAGGVVRLKRLIAPIETGIDDVHRCDPPSGAPARGCEVMDLEYATTTTATTTAVGSYAGQVSAVWLWVWTGSAMDRVKIASYGYDNQGRLLQVNDPRISAAGGLDQVTVYTYDPSQRLTEVTPGGEQHPYTFGYGTGGKTKTGSGDLIDPAPGRLLTVTRASLNPGTNTPGPANTTTVKYAVPLTTAGGPYNMDPATIGTWAQYDGPTDATAVFDPMTTFSPGQTPTADEYRKATVSYLNASGLEVNTAAPAAKNGPAEGFIDTTEYDARGNVVRTLDAMNRLLALRKLPGADASLTAWGLDSITDPRELAQLLDARTTYSEDGLDVLTTLGPLQRLAVANDPNLVRNLRARTTNVYDEGKPDGATYHLLTSTTSDGVEGYFDSNRVYQTGTAYDPIKTQNSYDPIDGAAKNGPTSGWVHKQPTTVTVDAGQPTALTSSVLYDARARAIRSSKPGSSGADAGTTVAVFYTAGTNAEDAACGNRPEWAGQPCLTRAGGPITGHVATRMPDELPLKRVTGYNAFGSPTVVTETAGSGTAQVVRTSTTTYDAADRVTSIALTATGPGAGQALPTTHTDYDLVTGDVTANWYLDSSGTKVSVKKEYDVLGRLTKYTDATGAWTTTTYDRLGQPLTVTDFAKDGSTVGSRSYTYDRALEPRGFVTKLTDSVAGDIVPTWGPDGQLESQTMPGGVNLTIGYDTARVPTSRTYTRASDGVVVASDTVVENHRGQWISHTTTAVGAQTYAYDRLGRLTDATQTHAGVCTARKYGFDTHTNRTSFTTATGATGLPCPTTTGVPATVTSTYDSADRLVTTTGANGSAWTYDQLGRITAMPTADGSKVASTGYFVNDLVASQEVPGVERTTWTLDPLQRFSQQNTFAWVNNAWANSTESINHYDGDGDEPSWIAEDITQPNKVSRYVEGADGNVALQTGKTGGKVLQLVDLHGDITATLDIPDGQTAADTTMLRRTVFDEFGVPQPMTSGSTSNAPPARYGWLGAAQRSADTPTGVILMGVRLYAPALGRFLQVDPVAGGSANAYDYCNADPVNCTDLAGTFSLSVSWKDVIKTVAVVGSIASFIPGPIGAAAGGVSAVAYAASGNTAMALTMAAVSAAQLVGAGPAVRVGAAMVSRTTNIARASGQAAARGAVKSARAAASYATRAVKSKAGAVAQRVIAKVKKNNIIRIGPTPAGNMRVSLGAQLKHWEKMKPLRRLLQPAHIHMEKARAGITWNPTGKSWKIWGKWG